MDLLHLTGPVLAGPDDVRAQAWVADGRITYDRPPGEVTRVDGWVLPGLVDAHCHVGLGPEGAVDDATSEQQALTDRDAGALLLRDAGSPVDTHWVDGRLDLPVIVRAGRHLARPRRYLRGFAEEVEPEQLSDAVARQAARGDGWVKLVGDWIDREVGDLAPCWPAATLVDAIGRAHEAGARVTAHCFSEDSLPDLIAAGIDGIEHATGLRAPLLDEVAARGIAVVPTLVNILTFPGIAAAADEKFPRYAAHMRRLYEERHATVRDAHDAGVRLFAGTDAGGSIAHGLVAEEVLELHAAGLPALAALSAACWGARQWLGRPGLGEGDPADLVVYPQDPRRDLTLLRAPTAVVLRGVRVARTGDPAGVPTGR